ncbi:MAG TPA: hypothetical protein DCQ84_14065 [Candidatus Competibacteraceae bacterium]|jgi:hypothetical protein|nr:hypothetical protein [Candidatus Competibacteraceae bacterium]
MSGPYEFETEAQIFGECRPMVVIYERDPESGEPDIVEVRTRGQRTVWNEQMNCLVYPVFDVLPLCPAWQIRDFQNQIDADALSLADDVTISEWELSQAA